MKIRVCECICVLFRGSRKLYMSYNTSMRDAGYYYYDLPYLDEYMFKGLKCVTETVDFLKVNSKGIS